MKKDLTQQFISQNQIDELGFDADYGGVRLCDIDDLELLRSWFSMDLFKSDNLMAIGLWIRINQLHPKFILKPQDIISDCKRCDRVFQMGIEIVKSNNKSNQSSMQMEVSHDNLPLAVSKIFGMLNNLERIILEKVNEQKPPNEIWFGLKDLCQYLPDKPSKQTVYGWVHQGLIPSHKGRKHLRFLKSEIDDWLKEGKQRTIADLSTEADLYINMKKGGKSI